MHGKQVLSGRREGIEATLTQLRARLGLASLGSLAAPCHQPWSWSARTSRPSRSAPAGWRGTAASTQQAGTPWPSPQQCAGCRFQAPAGRGGRGAVGHEGLLLLQVQPASVPVHRQSPGPFVWTADPKVVIAAAGHGYQLLDLTC
jgi:hypothetical protein